MTRGALMSAAVRLRKLSPILTVWETPRGKMRGRVEYGVSAEEAAR